ncbi:MAG: D-Ala-D-Ala carboxypeptidase family metallohydrolase [Alphaproteobacteria bacterium]|jgi:uncharacterized protein YcbK (DUF882 family)|nr:D-Ala-D-Ala carboxypeptidase family metallohydrolase [Alphaproteobacteria bacterium]MDP6566960.1 D-Ala-D-Ala carboxypeptidase family metallohydrolase [Alphaproteobacteria bacterium]MDP6813760.1 D-Ala-D-Ala carboxypeptidase family metallohydrolase [Alphaproteobacteria bacterium]
MTDFLPHFSRNELACPTTGEVRLQPGFGEALEDLRAAHGRPMRITSACRSGAHNRRIRGHERSLHLIGNPVHGTDSCAVDVAIGDGGERLRLLTAALRGGWSVGVASSFLHLDLRVRYTALPQVVYHYAR